jgi:hypothetical protein
MSACPTKSDIRTDLLVMEYLFAADARNEDHGTALKIDEARRIATEIPAFQADRYGLDQEQSR